MILDPASGHPPTDPVYEENLEARLLQVLNAGTSSFRSLVAQSEGAYPTDVLAALRRLRQRGAVNETESGFRVIGPAVPVVSGPSEYDESAFAKEDSDFPEPHPLDFDWRFSSRTLELLNRLVEERECTKIAVLGAPTLFKFLIDHGQAAHLFDRNEQIVQYLRKNGYNDITRCDLFHFSARGEFSCVLADPPWYLDYYHAFIESARRLLRPEGILFLSVLPRLTRPQAERDRSDILRFTQERGFNLVSAEPASLQYLSPRFEVEALKSEGLRLASWRSGDLYTFALTTRQIPGLAFDYDEEDELWRTWNVGRSLVKVRWDGTHGEAAFDFKSVSGAGDIRLRSVSRRSPLRTNINLWTSRNIALDVTRPDLVCAALQLLAEGHSPEDIETALSNAEKLNQLEVKKLRELLNVLIHEAKG